MNLKMNNEKGGWVKLNINDMVDQAIINLGLSQDVLAWVERFRRIRNKNTGEIMPIDFKARPYLKDIYKDCTTPGQEVWIMKGRQIEISTLVINCIHFLAFKYPGTIHAHAFPMESTRNDFSDMQLKPMYIISPLMREMMDQDSIDNKHLKSFSNTSNYLLTYVAGSGKKTLAIRSIPADTLWLDERDDMPPEHEGQLIESTARSGIKIIVRLGTPKLPGSEFDRGFRASTIHKWHIECGHCGTWQTLSLKHITRGKNNKRYYACHDCGKPLDRMRGEWRATNPGGIYKGYFLNQLNVPWLNADDITHKYKNAYNPFIPYSIREFWNEVMGQPYAGSQKPVELSDIYECLDPMRSLGASTGTGPVVLCGDWGNQTRWALIQMTNQGQVLLLDTGIFMDQDITRHADRASQLMRKYKAWGVFCAGYGKANNQTLMKAHPAKFYAFYLTGGKTQTVPQWQKKPLQYHITQEHSSFCEATLKLINPDNLVIPWGHCDPTKRDYDQGTHEKLETLFNELTQVQAQIVTNERGKEIKYNINDAHGFASLGYGWVMLMNKWQKAQASKSWVSGKGHRTRI